MKHVPTSTTKPTERPRRSTLLLLALFLAAAPRPALCADAPQATAQEVDALRDQMRDLRLQLERLEAHQPGPKDDVSTSELARRIEILAAEIERLKVGDAAALADQAGFGLGPAASKVYRTARGASIGGYGEMLYERFSDQRDDDQPSGKADRLDLLRAVVYVGYKFDDRWLLNSEIEFEHATTGHEGEVSVEFAYLDYLHRPEMGLRVGLLLVPVGLINELHEPTVYLGAKRPAAERFILPTTWREPGVGVFGEVGPWTYRSYLLTGFDATGFSAAGLRGGRQGGSEAKAENLAWAGRVDYTGRPGLTAGVSLYTGNAGQGRRDGEDRTLDVRTTLFDGHVAWSHAGFDLRALYTQAHVGDAGRLSESLELEGSDGIANRLRGGYLQIGYDLATRLESGPAGLTPFIRWERWNTQDDLPSGVSANPANDGHSLTIGLAIKPIEQIVIKADYQDVSNELDTATNQFNLAVGYVF